jgi:hypothetical protein
MKLYDVDGYEYPLLLSAAHADLIGATEHDTAADAAAPNRGATKQAWARYAVTQGLDPAAADAMTRAELIEAYG